MNIKRHKQSFEEIYSKLTGVEDEYNINFPLLEIDRIDWRRGRWNNDLYNYFYRRFSSHILSKLELSDNQEILVVGCGLGSDEKNIKAIFDNIDLWSVDISREMIKRAIYRKSPSRFSLAIAERLPFPDNCFDRVISREVIEHVIDPQMMVKEIYRVLKPNGIAIITTENKESFGPTNYYDSYLKHKIANLLKYPISESSYKDDPPTLYKMKSYVCNADLTMQDLFYDGALYKFLPEMSSLFRTKLPFIAHYFSCLENNRRLSYFFCDQVKYILKKLDSEITLSNPYYVCIRCKKKLFIENDNYICSECGHEFEMIDGIPNFLQDEENEEQIKDKSFQGTKSKNQSFMDKLFSFLFPRLNSLLRTIYIVIYFLVATLCTFFVKSNDHQLSHILKKDDPYQKYIKVS